MEELHAQCDGGSEVWKSRERDLLGGWSSDGSERYTKVARQRTSFMQQSVPRRDDVLMDFMETQDVLEPQKARTRRLLSSWTFIDVTCTFEASPQEEVDTAELEVHCEVAEDEAAALKRKSPRPNHRPGID